MLYGGAGLEGLELRAARDGSRRLTGRFPYGRLATLSDGGKNGRPRKEQFAPRAFAYRVEDPKADIHILVGHDYDRPLASRGAGTLDLKDTDGALTFEALIKPEMAEVSYVRDFLAAFSAGLIGGISPGFRMPPERTVPNAERVDEEDPKLGTALIRTISAALLYEVSLVTVPAYKETEVEARNWQPDLIRPEAGLHRTLNRWRA
jgi:hypothetical protein